MNRWLILSITIALSSCASLGISSSIRQYNSVKDQIGLGQKKDDVLKLLEPTQTILPQTARKQPDRYKEGNNLIEIFYYRITYVPDGVATDDEFTPYLFKNGTLESIGWRPLGGPKTTGHLPDVTNVNVDVKSREK